MRLRFALFGLAGLTALAACDVPPKGTNLEDVARFQSAVASIGCDMVGESDFLPVELQAGLTRQQTTDLVAYHISTEQAVALENGGARLTVGACAPETA